LGTFVNNAGYEVTEYSIGVEIDGKSVLIPTLVPGLTKEEVREVITASEEGSMPSDVVVEKAVAHAKKMLEQGKSPFSARPRN
jgi:hypothetical protein